MNPLSMKPLSVMEIDQMERDDKQYRDTFVRVDRTVATIRALQSRVAELEEISSVANGGAESTVQSTALELARRHIAEVESLLEESRKNTNRLLAAVGNYTSTLNKARPETGGQC